MAHIVRRTTPELAHLSHLDPLQIMRDLTGWDPFREMTTLPPFVSRPLAVFAPQFEVKETKDAFIFKADLPGIEEKNIEVSLTENRLTVSGLREEEDRHEGETFFADERTLRNFTRAFTLPDGVESEQARVKFPNVRSSAKKVSPSWRSSSSRRPLTVSRFSVKLTSMFFSSIPGRSALKMNASFVSFTSNCGAKTAKGRETNGGSVVISRNGSQPVRSRMI